MRELQEICVFAGPTRLQQIPPQAHVYAPAALGSVFHAVRAGYRRICLIDGVFGNVPSVWHKEILFAMKRGVVVGGAGSMGALRAAELHPFGMVGFGWVYRCFRRGALQDDDEVCVLHAVPELAYAPLSEAMVNIRYSLRAMRTRGQITRDSECRIVSILKRAHFSERNAQIIRDAFEQEFSNQGSAKFILYEGSRADIKSRDAQSMLNIMASEPMLPKRHDWDFPATNHWLYQFFTENSDLPPLSRWQPLDGRSA
jgi:hypothetical protein